MRNTKIGQCPYCKGAFYAGHNCCQRIEYWEEQENIKKAIKERIMFRLKKYKKAPVMPIIEDLVDAIVDEINDIRHRIRMDMD